MQATRVGRASLSSQVKVSPRCRPNNCRPPRSSSREHSWAMAQEISACPWDTFIGGGGESRRGIKGVDPHALRQETLDAHDSLCQTVQAQVTVRTLHLSCKIRLPVLNSAFCCRCFGLSQKRCANSQQHRLIPAAEHSEFVALSTVREECHVNS